MVGLLTSDDFRSRRSAEYRVQQPQHSDALMLLCGTVQTAQLEMFGPKDSDNFEGLGLAKTLAAHLIGETREGDIINNLQRLPPAL